MNTQIRNMILYALNIKVELCMKGVQAEIYIVRENFFGKQFLVT